MLVLYEVFRPDERSLMNSRIRLNFRKKNDLMEADQILCVKTMTNYNNTYDAGQ